MLNKNIEKVSVSYMILNMETILQSKKVPDIVMSPENNKKFSFSKVNDYLYSVYLLALVVIFTIYLQIYIDICIYMQKINL